MDNLWDCIDIIKNTVKRADNVLLFVDFDGTLSPIVSTPSRAKLPSRTKKILERLVKNGKICLGIISGRELSDLKRKVGINGIAYSGNHGLEWEIRGKAFKTYLPITTHKILRTAEQELEKIRKRFPGSSIEPKGFSLAFHYRRVRDEIKPAVEKALDEILSRYLVTKQVSLIKDNYTYDLRGTRSWTKGSVTGELKKELLGGTGVLIYIGDSATDEDVFEKLNENITIKVGLSGSSKAKYYLNDTSEVSKFLNSLSDFFDENKSGFRSGKVN